MANEKEKRLRDAYIKNQDKFIEHYYDTLKSMRKLTEEGKGIESLLEPEYAMKKIKKIQELKEVLEKDFGEKISVPEFFIIMQTGFNTFMQVLEGMVCKDCKKEGKIEETKSNMEKIVNNICNSIKL